MQSHFPLGASTSPTHSKWNHSIEQPQPGSIITSNHITRLWTTTKTPELIPSSGYLITGLLSGWLLFSYSSSFTSTSLSSLLYRIKMCYPHFNVFSTRKGLLCKFFCIFWVQVPALLLSFLKAFLDSSTRREVWAVGKSMLSVAKAFSRHKVPREIDWLRDELRYQSFSTAVKSPLFPKVGTY